MAKLPERQNKTATAIFDRIKRDDTDWRRVHLGASVIGDSCNRALWYSFRWACDPNFDGRMLRLFERGQREEDWIIEELRAVGMQVVSEDDDGNQYRFKALGGHFAGSQDGAVLGVLEAPKTWHLLEVKTSNAKRFAALQKAGVRENQPKHFDQMQIYMHEMGLKRALYICVCKNDDHIFTERVKYDKAHALAILAKAERVITSPEPLSRLSEDPSWFECKFCDHHDHCQLGRVERLERNCRTCLSSTPLPDGTWGCEYLDKKLSLDEQKAGCDGHLFIPKMLEPWEAVETEGRSVVYEDRDGGRFLDNGLVFGPMSDNVGTSESHGATPQQK